MVALNKQTRFSLGVSAKMYSTSSSKPMFSISSASSNTTYFTVEMLSALRFIKSIKRPGVATIICAPRLISEI